MWLSLTCKIRSFSFLLQSKLNVNKLLKRIISPSDGHEFRRNITYKIMEVQGGEQINQNKEISEGLAVIKTAGNVFYNPVQEFNRDLSISVLNTFARRFEIEKQIFKNKIIKEVDWKTYVPEESTSSTDVDVQNEGIVILEALSATGLRSIRYAKEVQGVKQIISNDFSFKAVEDIKRNIENNNVGDIVQPSHSDATMIMYQHRKEKQFDVIDLDPYGCPSIFLDSAVQSVKDGGLLLVTATDMAVLAGNSPETCHAKYGSVSLRLKSCHEMALRILLQCIESHANRYSRYIVPLLSISADFYVRVFVRIYSGASKCKFTTSKLSNVYHCTGCDSFDLQHLGILKKNEKQVKFALPAAPNIGKNCQHCNGTIHIGGPIWSAPIHSLDFVKDVLNTLSSNLGTYRRIEGILSMICEELPDCPLYYTLEKLSGTLHLDTPPMLTIRSAILNAGYRVSLTHMHKTSIKTDAPSRVIWDIMRCWEKIHPVNKKRRAEGIVQHLLSIEPLKEHSFNKHPEANPDSRHQGVLRFQENPQPHWGPGTRATAMVGEQKILKSVRNQGKRKRELSEDPQKIKHENRKD